MTSLEPQAPGQSTSPAPEEPPNTNQIRGRRAEAFERLLNNTLEHSLAKISYANLAQCFPSWAEYKPKTLKEFHGNFVSRLRATSKTNFEDILEQRRVVENLNALDHLIADGLTRKEAADIEARATGNPVQVPSAPHQLPPESLLAASLSPFLTEQHTVMSKQLIALETQNEKLAESVSQQNTEIDLLVRGLESVIEDLERAAVMVQDQDLNNLPRETRAIEDEIHASQ